MISQNLSTCPSHISNNNIKYKWKSLVYNLNFFLIIIKGWYLFTVLGLQHELDISLWDSSLKSHTFTLPKHWTQDSDGFFMIHSNTTYSNSSTCGLKTWQNCSLWVLKRLQFLWNAWYIWAMWVNFINGWKMSIYRCSFSTYNNMPSIRLYRDTERSAHTDTDLLVLIILVVQQRVQKEAAMHLKEYERVC